MKITFRSTFLRALLIAGGLSLSAHAMTVTTAADELNVPAGANLSLREAVRDAAPGDTIVFAPALSGQTITLTPALGGEIVIGKNLTIDASSLPFGVIISAGGTRRIFSVSSGQSLTLTGLTLRDGNGQGAASNTFGGAILNLGSLTMTRCFLAANSAASSGGGVHNAGTATVDACTFSGNSAEGSGGGFNGQGTATVTRCTFSGNTAAGASGGGGAVNGTNNVASNVTLENCTLVGNSATGASGTGGGVRQVGGTVTIKNCIVASNTATVPLTENLAGTITQTGANLTSGDPLVAPLGNYGGPTQTRPPLLGSPAIDASAGSAFTTDQRGYPVFGVVDLGAAEGVIVVTTSTFELDASSLSGTGISLREAVRDTPSGGAIGFAPALSGSTLGMSEIVIDKDVTIDASSLPAGVTLSAGASSRIFVVNSSQSLALTGLRLRDGNGTGTTSSGFGGAILNQGTLALTRCILTANSATQSGGAVHNIGTATVDACTFSGNSAQGAGGGINSQATLTVTRSTFSGNSAAGPTLGGGAVNGVNNPATNISLESCTLVGNSATGSSGIGGGVRRLTGTVGIKNCIVAGNTAAIIGTQNLGGNITQTGANLTSGDPLVAPLTNYGGPTPTRALLPASPARNAAVGSTFTSDQRGFPIVGTADLGAYEAGTLATNYNAYIWESLPTVGNGTASDPLHAQTYDYDGDGVTNVNEWLAQTSAIDPLSYLRFTSVVRGPTALEFTYPSVLGRNYQYEASPDLVTWFPFSGDAGTGAPITLFVTPGTPSGFIRVRVGP